MIHQDDDSSSTTAHDESYDTSSDNDSVSSQEVYTGRYPQKGARASVRFGSEDTVSVSSGCWLSLEHNTENMKDLTSAKTQKHTVQTIHETDEWVMCASIGNIECNKTYTTQW